MSSETTRPDPDRPERQAEADRLHVDCLPTSIPSGPVKFLVVNFATGEVEAGHGTIDPVAGVLTRIPAPVEQNDD